MSTFPNLIYEKDLSNGIWLYDTIRIDEFDNTVNDSSYIYSGLTLILNYTGFTGHFDTTGHTYSNVILNNDVYTYTGITGETHYFEIHDFYYDTILFIDPQLGGLTESEVIDGFATTITGCTDQLSLITGTCCPTEAVLSNLPWVFTTNHGTGDDNCDDFVARRTENGFTVDFIFNRNSLPWSEGGVFFYTGVRDEYDPANYGDNNLSFAFTDDGRIKWSSYRYSGYCESVSGYTELYYINSGQTEPLCTNGTTADFNITISFERYYQYSGCTLANEGGWNDLMIDESAVIDNVYYPELVEALNNHWQRERWKRLGMLVIYHNGRPIYKLPARNLLSRAIDRTTDWEEIVLSERGYQPFVQAVGGGVSGCEGIHEGVCCFDIKYVGYFEDVMDYPYIRNRYLNITKVNYNIVECNDPCDDTISTVTPYVSNFSLTLSGDTAINLLWVY